MKKPERNIPISRPFLGPEEEAAVIKSLRSGWVVQGPYVRELEKRFARYTGLPEAVAFSSCTAAQMVASRCIGLKPGDEVIVPAFTWISTANAAEYLGARPVFADIDLATYNLDPSEIERLITPRTRAIFPVNLFGLPADLPAIMKIARKHRLKVVEDCACSLGGWLNGIHTGGFGLAGCFSMHPRKSITSGEGGMLVTRSRRVAVLARALRDHGAVRSDYARHRGKRSFLLSDYPYLGYNFRLTDLQAAIGVEQFKKFNRIMAIKRRVARVYNAGLKDLPFLRLPSVGEGAKHGWQSYVCLFLPDEIDEALTKKRYRMIERIAAQRNSFMGQLEEMGIATRQGTHAVHIQKYYARKYGLKKYDFVKSYIADRCSISLPIYPGLSEDDQAYVIETITRIGKKLNF